MSDAIGSVGLLLLLFIFLLGIMVPVFIGVFVYRDAKSRGMNALLWTLLAVLAPTFIGLIIYLLVRNNYSDMRCPKCDTTVNESYVVCPKCGAKLKSTCPNCENPVDAGWHVCPYCAGELPAGQSDYVKPVKREDKGLGKILLVIILIPVLLVVLGFLSIMGFKATGSVASVSFTQDVEIFEDSALFANCDVNSKDTAYVFKSVTESGEDKEIQYMVYAPGVGQISDFDHNLKGVINKRIEFKLEGKGTAGADEMYFVTVMGEKDRDVEVYYNGKKLNAEIIEVDYDLMEYGHKLFEQKKKGIAE